MELAVIDCTIPRKKYFAERKCGVRSEALRYRHPETDVLDCKEHVLRHDSAFMFSYVYIAE